MFLFLLLSPQCVTNGCNETISFVSDYFGEGQGFQGVWRKDSKRSKLDLCFFLLWDAARNPSVLIGSLEHPCAGNH